MVLQESMGIRADLLRNLPKKDYVPNGYHSLMMIQGASMSPLFLLDTFDHFLNFFKRRHHAQRALSRRDD